ncbi:PLASMODESMATA CALLOSE-BINDING PROTEIN 3-like isoform X2 [Aristolochia californica]|uniref:PLASMODESMATA CALLOSE-BINDING PROTEIN 3-like isoform X2 n=1 Tax=Aristolochia californica TaxID=171875 RepID=UPI0035DBA55F
MTLSREKIKKGLGKSKNKKTKQKDYGNGQPPPPPPPYTSPHLTGSHTHYCLEIAIRHKGSASFLLLLDSRFNSTGLASQHLLLGELGDLFLEISFMGALVILLFILGMAGASSGTQWCVCRTDLSDAALQKTIDYACGAGADCKPILQNGACFQPNTVKAHCSYAANSYYQNKGQGPGSCEFSGTATVVTTDPSAGGSCSYPTSASSTPTTGAPTTVGGTPGSSTSPTSTNPGTSTPNTFTPIGGGISSGGLGPTGTGITTDQNSGIIGKMDKGLLSLALLVSGMFCLWA